MCRYEDVGLDNMMIWLSFHLHWYECGGCLATLIALSNGIDYKGFSSELFSEMYKLSDRFAGRPRD